MTARPAVAKQTGADDAYDALRRIIRAGDLGPGERLVESDLAERLDLGRHAVRTALARLEQDGLVERLPYRGARVRLIGESEAVEILEARAVLEGLAARYAAERATLKDVAALRAVLTQMKQRHGAGDLLAMSELTAALHARVIAIAQLPRVAKVIEDLHAQNVRHQFRTVLVPGRPPKSLQEHRAVVDAIARGDGAAAESAMRAHLSQVIRTLRSLTRPSSRP